MCIRDRLAQGVGDDVESLELIGGLVPGVQEVAAVHTLKIEAVQLLDELGKLGVHVNVLSKGETITMSRCAPACACGQNMQSTMTRTRHR